MALKSNTLSWIAVAALTTPGAALAQEAGQFAVGAGVSTLGLTLEGSYRINDRFGVRVPVVYFGYDDTITEDGTDFDGEITLGGAALLGDFYTGLGGLRVSGGAFFNAYGAEGTAEGDATVNGVDYSGVDLLLDAEPENRVMPMLSIGYDGNLGGGWMLSADLGAMYAGDWSVDLEDRAGVVPQSDIDAEVGDISDDLPEIIPYFKLTATFRF